MKFLRILIGIFERFLMIPKDTNIALMYKMIRINIPEAVAINTVNSEETVETQQFRLNNEKRNVDFHSAISFFRSVF